MQPRSLLIVACGLLALGACKFPPPADVPDEDAVSAVDAAADAPLAACTANQRTCVAGLYSECDAAGHYVQYQVPNGAADGSAATLVMHDYQCPLGCHNSEPRCLDVDATNGLNAALDATDTSPAGLDLVIDDPTGVATAIVTHDRANPTVTIAFANGSTISVAAQVLAQAAGPDLQVLELRSLSIRAGSRLKFVAVKPIAIVSHFDIFIAGALDYSGTGNAGQLLHPGCDVATQAPATGGAGNVTRGGAASTGTGGGMALPDNPGLQPLEGGCHASIGFGGGGLQLVSRRRIALAATGTIDVAGRGGVAYTVNGGFMMTGGGSGGNVVLEAPGIGLASGAIIVGRGGSGAAGNTSTRMAAVGVAGDQDVTTSDVPGATCPDCAAVGGVGGTEHTMAGNATGAANAVAGGGGSAGRAVLRAKVFVIPPAGTMKILSTSTFIQSR